MKTVVLTASLVTNLFLAAMIYGFTSGKVERHQPDFVTELQEAAPMHVAKR